MFREIVHRLCKQRALAAFALEADEWPGFDGTNFDLRNDIPTPWMITESDSKKSY